MGLVNRLKGIVSSSDGVEYQCPSCGVEFDTAHERCPRCGESDIRERGGFEFKPE